MQIVDDFHRLWYDAHAQTWANTFWRGVPLEKCPMDLWVYQEIIQETRPTLIIETGTRYGGSALFFADMLSLVNPPGYGGFSGQFREHPTPPSADVRVVTIDITLASVRKWDERVSYLQSHSLEPPLVENLKQLARHNRTMVVLDSDHSANHVLTELHAYAPMVTPGCYLVVEDTNVNGHPVYPNHGPGPAEALATFLAKDDSFEVDRSREKYMLTMHPGGWLRKR